MTEVKAKNSRWYMSLFSFALAGMILRLWNWSGQILLDDEWHALNFVFNRTLIDVFMQQGLGANSIPVNVYSWLVLHTTGWSEPLLRLPSIVAGISALVILPMLVRRVWGTSVAVITAALLAVSPAVIFYSRIMRPYAPAMLFAASSVLLTLAWMKEGRRKDLLFSSLCGSLAIYYHLYTAIPVGVPFLVACTAAVKPLGRRFGMVLESRKPFSDILPAGGIMALLVGLFVVIPNVLNPWWSHGIHGVDHATLDTAVTVLSLVSGTRNPLLMAVILVLLTSGFCVMVRRSRAAGVSVILSFLIFFLIMANTTQEGAHAGIQVARYGITFFPLSFIAIAASLARIGEFIAEKYAFLRQKPVLLTAAAAVWLPFLATSPLWTTYAGPNNFTGHSAYQYRYDPIRWLQRSPERDLAPSVYIEYAAIPPFYLQSPLVPAAKGIIEYPVMIGDQLNLYYYYQHFHRRPVVAGFAANNTFVPVEPGRDFVYGNWSFDSVLCAMPEPLRRKASWRTMVDITDTSGLRSRYRGWLLIIHHDPWSEITRSVNPEVNMSNILFRDTAGIFGEPRFVDEHIAVWKIE